MKFIIEQSAYSGVLKIAGKVAHDMELVTRHAAGNPCCRNDRS